VNAPARGPDARAAGVRDDHGRILRASWSLEDASEGYWLFLESQSGRSSGPRARNPDYRAALELLLRRLGDQGAVLRSAEVASRPRSGVVESSRSLIPASGLPLPLAGTDSGQLRDEFIQLQRTAGQTVGARGTGAQHKRVRLGFTAGPDLEMLFAALGGFHDDAIEAVETAAGDLGALAIETDATRRRAVERYAVRRAREHYSARFSQVESHECTDPFDLLCSGPGELRVEVKGTRSRGAGVAMTAAEVALARDRAVATELFVVSDIVLRRAEDGTLEGSEGTARVFPAFAPRDDQLTALVYRCILPEGQAIDR
jgi:hypothetical protein